MAWLPRVLARPSGLVSAAVWLRTQPLAGAAHATPALLLKMNQRHCNKAAQPSRSWRVAMAGSLVASVLAAHQSQQAACAPKRKAGTAAAAQKKAPGPALPAVQAAFNKDKTYQVEKFIASRLANGKKEFLVRWQGYEAKHDTWEPLENLANLVEEMAAFDRDKEKGNQEAMAKLAAEKAARAKAREQAGNSPGVALANTD